MKRFITKNKLKSILLSLLSAIFWIALWALAAFLIDREIKLPSPARTVGRLIELMGTAAFWRTVGASILRILIGYLLGVAAGTLLAILTAFSRPIDTLTSPLNTVIRATPVASFIILVLLWLGRDQIPSFIAFLMVTPIVWNSLKAAIRTVDPSLLEMTKAYRMRPFRRLRFLYLPAVLPQYTAAMITSLGLAWKAGIAAEALCRPSLSIGKDLIEARNYLETVDLFAWTATVILLSVMMEALLRALLKRFGQRKEAAV